MQVETAKPTFSAGQLAKSPCLTIKSLYYNKLGVAGQAKNKPRTHALTREVLQMSENRQANPPKQSERDFTRVVPQVFDPLENTKVIFHNTDFVSSIIEDYHPPVADLFLEWVKMFALIRSPYRSSPMECVVLSDDDDFLSTLRLFKLKGIKPKKPTEAYYDKIWRLITNHYPDKPFRISDLMDKTVIPKDTISRMVCQFVHENKVCSTKKRGITAHFYQVIKP